MTAPNTPVAPSPRMPPAIWALGFVSLLMDVSSELIHSLLPVFMFTALGMSVFTIGLIEGAAQATALIGGEAIAADIADLGVDAAALSPQRPSLRKAVPPSSEE